jgi:hypothetical protein
MMGQGDGLRRTKEGEEKVVYSRSGMIRKTTESRVQSFGI